jgi:hypothetical protein
LQGSDLARIPVRLSPFRAVLAKVLENESYVEM